MPKAEHGLRSHKRGTVLRRLHRRLTATGAKGIEEQLRGACEPLQATIERLEASNDGLLSSSAALLSANEELKAVSAELECKVGELLRANGDLESLLESSQLSAIFLDRRLHVQRFTPALAALLDLTPADHGRPFQPLASKIGWPGFTHDGRTVLKDLTPLEFEVPNLAPPRHFLARVLPCRTADGGTEGVVVTFVDITERKRAEGERERLLAEVQQGAAELAAVFQALPFLVSVHDREGRYLRVNPTTVKLLGFDPTRATREEIARRLKAHFLDGRPLTPENMPSSRALRGEAVYDVEYAISDARGEERVLRFSAVPLKAGEKVYGAVFAQQDVTERKRAEVALKESEATLRGILDATRESVFLFDANGVILLGNEIALRRLGRPAAEVIGKDFRELVPEPLIAGREAQLRRVVESGQSGQFEDERAGMHFAHSFYPVVDEEGRVVRVACFSRDVTVQKEAEDALRRRTEELEVTRAEAEGEKRLLEAVMEALPVGVCITDVRGGILRANSAYEEIWRGPRPAAFSVGDYAAYRAWWPDTGIPLAPEEWASAQAVQNGVAVVGQILEIQRFDGSRATVLNGAAPVRDADGRVVGSAVAVQDITDLRRAEEALRDSEERFRRLFEGHKAIMLLIEPQSGAIVDANAAAADFYGCSRDELRRMKIQEINLLPPEEVAAERRKAVEARRNYFVFPHRLTDGRTRWVEVYSTPVEVRGTALLFSVIHDITERRQAEEALHESEQRLRSHVENSPMAVVEWDENFLVTRWAGEAERMFGWTEAEVVGRPLADLHLIAAEDVPIVEGVMARLTDGVTRRVASANRNITKDGRVIHCEWYNSVLFGADGRMTSVLSLVLNVTERERYERELLAAREAAETANRAKSDFLAVMSHEIRTPMNGILGMSELLASTSLESRQREYVWGIRTSGKLLLGIINDILDFSKIEARGLELESAPFDLAAAVEDTVHLEAEPASQKRLELCCLLAADLPEWVEGDRTRLQQVLLNLIGNAVKFTDTGEVVVRVTLVEREADSAWVRFEVADTGVGVPQGAQAKLFEPFAQAEASTTRRYGGTGLGLAICRRLVEAMGGRIGFESRQGEGAAFWFTVPFRGAAGPRERPLFPGRRALVATAGETARGFLREQLLRLGIETEEASNAALAEASLARGNDQRAPFSLAFVDVQLPGLERSDLMARARREASVHGASLILLTSVVAEGRAAGATEHLLKPVRETKLPYCIRAALREARPIETEPPALPPSVAKRGRVLLAEDNRVNQIVAAAMLERLGLEVDVVEDGAAALEAVFARHYDAVFLDWRMPVMDGLEAAREIRRKEGKDGHTLLIAVTANARTADRQRCLEAGMDEHLPKPLTLEALEEVLSRIGDLAPPGAEVRADADEDGASGGGDLSSFVERVRKLAVSLPPGRIPTILETFLEDGRLKIKELRRAAREGDLDAISSLAHGIRGSGSIFGTDRMVELSRVLEGLARSGSQRSAEALVDELEEELERVVRFVLSGGLGAMGLG